MNLKNFKKGFTLVELLAVIAIIGVIITLSLASYKSIKDKTLKKDKDNLISYIETAAEKYIHDTGVAKLNIETLITEGYISPDDEKGYIYDPVTKEVLNCYVINAEYKEGKYEAKLSEEKQEKDGKCKISIEMLLDICVYDDKEGCKEISSDSWFAENVKLAVKKNNEIKILEEGKFNWLSNTGFEGHDSIIETNIKNNGEVTYKVKVYDSNDTFIGEAQKTIKIDLKKPKIINVNVPDGWLQSKTVTVEATDGIISGIYGYSFNTNNNCLATYQLGNTKNYTSNGSYYVCVKDKAGNVTGPTDFIVDKIDSNAPTITSVEIPKGWSQSKTVTVKANDNGSGIQGYSFNASNNCLATYQSGNTKNYTSNGSYYVCVKDNVGNVTEPSKFTIDKIDSNAPTITSVEVPKGWSQSKTVTVKANDNGSGIQGYSFNTSNNCLATYQSGNTKNYTSNGSYYVCVKDNIGNVTGPTVFTVDKIDREKPVYVSGGNISLGNITTVVYEDKPEGIEGTDNSGVANKYYYISTSSTTPLSNANGWQTKTTFTTECGNIYHVWSKAIDNAGNESDIKSLGSVNSGTCCTDTEEYYGCSDKGYDISDKGWKLYRIKTECLGANPTYGNAYFKEPRISCITETIWSDWGACSDKGWQSRTGTYYEGGELKTKTEQKACITDTVCGDYGDCNAEGWQYAPCWHYEGGNKINDPKAKKKCTCESWGECIWKNPDNTSCYNKDHEQCTCGYQFCLDSGKTEWKQACNTRDIYSEAFCDENKNKVIAHWYWNACEWQWATPKFTSTPGACFECTPCTCGNGNTGCCRVGKYSYNSPNGPWGCIECHCEK